MDFHKKSHEKHAEGYRDPKYLKELEWHKDWFKGNTLNLWRHKRMLEILDPFLGEYKNARWLTVGDGRFGTSAMYIAERGGDPVATDIDDTLLNLAREHGLVQKVSRENAEALQFDDGAFDFVFCKEAYHHFPRPYLAVYEMLRCAGKAVILTEPRDFIPQPALRKFLRAVKNALRKFLGKPIPHTDEGSYETSGNYIYTLSEREVEKVALGLNLPAVGFRSFHDVYLKEAGGAGMEPGSPLLKKLKRQLLRNRILCLLGLSAPNRISAILFKDVPTPALRGKLAELGVEVRLLPRNPFI